MVNSSSVMADRNRSRGVITPGSILIVVTSLMLLVYVLYRYKPWSFLQRGKMGYFQILVVSQPILAFIVLILGVASLIWWWRAGRVLSFIVLGIGGINVLLWLVQAVMGIQGLNSATTQGVLLYLLRDVAPPLVVTGGVVIGALLNVLRVGVPEYYQLASVDVESRVITQPQTSVYSEPFPKVRVEPRSASASPPLVKAWLQIQVTGANVTTVPVQDGLLIGRSPEADVVLPNPSVSRRHAIIRYAQGKFFIQDQGSANGIYVNGRRVSAIALKNGDRIRIGTVEMVFRQE